MQHVAPTSLASLIRQRDQTAERALAPAEELAAEPDADVHLQRLLLSAFANKIDQLDRDRGARSAVEARR